ncbi:hypothetical protein N658DRAFT_127429 [Parathielavia hyrcaniae]|uniref:Uncharacterized protein n=1 Tax=Parathielavia hyrcaniae TaxID=113614 RepID=A0AAN6Q8S3_9PEZI|nr:hypothetical protein N658DRAFT_127429 [Parathielavia hyrcaniae]
MSGSCKVAPRFARCATRIQAPVLHRLRYPGTIPRKIPYGYHTPARKTHSESHLPSLGSCGSTASHSTPFLPIFSNCAGTAVSSTASISMNALSARPSAWPRFRAAAPITGKRCKAELAVRCITLAPATPRISQPSSRSNLALADHPRQLAAPLSPLWRRREDKQSCHRFNLSPTPHPLDDLGAATSHGTRMPVERAMAADEQECAVRDRDMPGGIPSRRVYPRSESSQLPHLDQQASSNGGYRTGSSRLVARTRLSPLAACGGPWPWGQVRC